MTDDSFPPFPFANIDASAPPMPKEKKARKVKEATNGRRKRKGRRRKQLPVGKAPEKGVLEAELNKIAAKAVHHDELLSVSKDDILFINGVLQSMQAFPRKQQERIIVALSKVFG